MLYNQFKINIIKSKDDKHLEKKINCKMSKNDIESKQNPYNNCNCNCNYNTMNRINVVILKILIVSILTLNLVILFFGAKHFSERKYIEQYLEISKRQEQTLQAAQEELHVLKMEMLQFMLQSTYENRISNRFRRSAYYYNSSRSIKPFTHEFSNSLPDRYKRDADTLKPHNDKAISTFVPNQTLNYEKNISTTLNKILSKQFKSNLTVNLTKNEKQNLLYDRNVTFLLNVKTQNRKKAKDDMSSSDVLRFRRNGKGSEERKKKRRQNKEKCNRSCTRLGPLIATFVGEIPEQQSSQSVSIGPWIKSSQNISKQFDFNKFYLVENNMAIEVSLNGLYMILTQIFYDGSAINHAYWILVESEGASTPRKLSVCAVASAAAGVSCHASVISYLRKGDRLLIQQQHNNRYINLREGFSQVQLVLLSEEKTLKVE